MFEILIVEDETIIRDSLTRLLERHGYRVTGVGSVAEAESEGLSSFDLIIADLRLPGEDGSALITRAAPVPVLIMTSYSSVQSAVEAMKMGAVDYISKPFNHDEMVISVARILESSLLERQNKILQKELSKEYPVDGMVGESTVMKEVFERISKVATTDTTVLILGETGTGKELVARALHAQSQRNTKPLISVNCASIAENLIESELFGHEKGAFTGAAKKHRGLVEAADGGTLFLDEIGELSLEAQARLLRVLQEGEIRRVGSNQARLINVRFIVATHRDLQQLVQEHKFREDLFYRLNVVEINLPPLRERANDIVALAKLVLNKMVQRIQRQPLSFSKEAMAELSRYHWPGNVRELENVIERAVILCNGVQIEAADLSLKCIDRTVLTEKVDPASESDKMSLDDYFVTFVKNNQGEMNETELAKQLGISRKSLWERRQR
ncbi:MAG: sigma-54 dependent transcriptional regulator, partial [Gammaproteobacteria bacterium]|nr:sigma-54 dependent transcriptional regulator [Gammaproteobacteria bacterium]